MIEPSELNPSSDWAQCCWKTSTSTPNDAPTDSRFSRMAVTGITTDLKVTSSKRKASTRTSPMT